MKKLNKIFCGLIYILPAVLVFSYYPIFSFGSSETMNFELSLPLLWLVVFDVIAFVIFILRRDFTFFKKWQWLLFPVFATVSLIWSHNFVRGILTVGILWLVTFAIFSILRLRKIFYDERGFYYTFLKFFFGSAVFISAWCVLQCVMDVFGVSREVTLLCRGCTYRTFGFPHPNGFAIEPQFMGNLLLAPTVVMGGILVARKHSLRFKFLFFFITATLFLTFSRGAIYAFIVAMIFMSGALIVRRVGFKKIAMMWGAIMVSFLFALNLQGILAQISPTNDTYVSGVSKVLNHLSLGIIDVGGRVESSNDGDNESEFDGYVEESTNVRMELTENAVKVWSKDFRTVMFGVGIGGAGQAMYDAGLTGSPKEIVQNEYASILLETGLVGVLIIIFTIFMILKIIRKNPMNIIILTLGVAYAVSLLFFSGFANVLQIYLILPVFYIVFLKKLVS